MLSCSKIWPKIWVCKLIKIRCLQYFENHKNVADCSHWTVLVLQKLSPLESYFDQIKYVLVIINKHVYKPKIICQRSRSCQFLRIFWKLLIYCIIVATKVSGLRSKFSHLKSRCDKTEYKHVISNKHAEYSKVICICKFSLQFLRIFWKSLKFSVIFATKLFWSQ